ncbi:MAG: FHA domain-containing protein [Planctomycetota bacterium]|jgi:hypothetical protein
MSPDEKKKSVKTDSIHGENLTEFIRTEDFRKPGGGGVRLFVISGPLTGENFLLEPGETPLGRRAENKIVLAERGVSKAHCVFALEESGTCYVTDTDSRNGTFVNGKRLEPGPRLQLTHGDKIRVCENVLLLVQPEKPGLAEGESAVDVDVGKAAIEAEDFVSEIQDLVDVSRRRRTRGT